MYEMATDAASTRLYEFESFQIDPISRRLLRRGEVVPLTSRTFDILLALVENSGRTVEKDELMDRVWADTFVEEGNLNRNISMLRKVLGDDGHEQRIIRTVPKHGYRFTAPVHEVSFDGLIEDKTRVSLNVWEETVETNSKNVGLAVGLCVLILIAGGFAAWMWTQSGHRVNIVDAGHRGALAAVAEKGSALDLYQQGRTLWQTRNGEDLHSATLLLERSVGEDPSFALAHTALADAYAFDYRNWPKAEATAQTAIALDPTLGEPHATIGFVRMFWEWRLADAESELKQAVELSPNYATAHQWYALTLFAVGRSGQAALAELKRAQEIEPDSVAIGVDICQAFYFLHRYDEAIAQCEAAATRAPANHNAYLNLYEIYNAAGMYDRAVDAYFKSQETHGLPLSASDLDQLRTSYKNGGIKEFWRMRIATLPTNESNHYTAAQHFARLGDVNEAFRRLRLAYEKRAFEMTLFISDPVFDDLRSDPRYVELRSMMLRDN